ncbi:MAG: RNA 2',3'-cyclic phosphodiesterase [Fibrobacteres bacterium]|nr:RNA 2',3'-cyclic phosphodiesterase [Fibrobacterota bacterium]
MPRLFIALAFPEAVKEKLSGISAGIPGADWVEPQQYHLTLRFLGEVDGPVFLDLREGLMSLSARSFYLGLRGLGVFPPRGAPETLWVGVERNEELKSLRNKIESLLVRRGQPPETRKFHPHVSLARVRASRPEWVGAFVAGHSLFSVPEIAVQSFALFSSKLTPDGAVHTLEREYPLEGILDAEGREGD